MKVIISFLIFFSISKVMAYSEFSRHGYVNCTSCHLSPSGGGLLNPYGRELSRAIVSTWGVKNEQYFAYNSFPQISKSDKFLIGAFIRGLQAYRTDKHVSEARAILMQADADVAYNAKDWAIVGSIGRQELRKGLESHSRLFSRRHYSIYRIDSKNNVRAGKFLKFYGLNDPNHQMFVRRYLNFGFDTESYNLEYSHLGDNFSAYVTQSLGNFRDKYSPNHEKGVTASASMFFAEKQKAGISFFKGSEPLSRRNTYGVWGIFSFHPKIFTLHEVDFQNKRTKSSGKMQSGYVSSNKFNYEPLKGLIGFLTYDLANLNPINVSSKRSAYGTGIQFFPRPHFELVTSWQKEEIVKINSNSQLYSVTLHFYL